MDGLIQTRAKNATLTGQVFCRAGVAFLFYAALSGGAFRSAFDFCLWRNRHHSHCEQGSLGGYVGFFMVQRTLFTNQLALETRVLRKDRDFPATMAARFQPMNYAPDARDDIGGGNHHPILPLPGSALLDLKFNTPPYGGPPRGSIPGAISDTDRREKSSNRGFSSPDDPDISPPYRTYFDNTFDSPQR